MAGQAENVLERGGIALKIFDVNPSDLIEVTANELQARKIPSPAFTLWVKSGAHKERAPSQKNWFYQRMASILYRLYRDGWSGTGRLATYYGGRKARGTAPHEFRPAGRKIIRVALQELEKAHFIQKATKGRVVSPDGEKLLHACANRVGEFVKKRDAERIVARAEKEKQKSIERRMREETRKAEQKFDKGKRPDKKEKTKKEE